MKMKGLRLLLVLGVVAAANLPALSSADPPPCPGNCADIFYICLGICSSAPTVGSTGQQCTAPDGSIKNVAHVSCLYCVSAACVF